MLTCDFMTIRLLWKTSHTCDPDGGMLCAYVPISIFGTKSSEKVCLKQGLTSELSDYETAKNCDRLPGKQSTDWNFLEKFNWLKNKSLVYFPLSLSAIFTGRCWTFYLERAYPRKVQNKFSRTQTNWPIIKSSITRVLQHK